MRTYDWGLNNSRRLSAAQHRLAVKKWLVEHLGGRCVICSYDKCLRAFEFHHQNPEEKDFAISKYMNASKEKMLTEIKKCILVCANCHREIHDGVHPSVFMPENSDEPEYYTSELE